MRGIAGPNIVTKKFVEKMRLRGKLDCPYCHNTLVYVYADMQGHSTQKCFRCKKQAYVDLNKMETACIVDDTATVFLSNK